MDPLGDPLTTHPIQTAWVFTMEPYLSQQFGFIDDPDRQFGNCSVWILTWTRSDGPEPLLTLVITINNQSIGHLHREKGRRHTPYPFMKMGVNAASTIFGLSSLVIKARCMGYCVYIMFCQFF